MSITMLQSISIILSLIFMVSSQDSFFPETQYQQEIVYRGVSEVSSRRPEILPLSVSREIPLYVGLRPAGNVLRTPVLHSVNLFTPNTVQQPAETPGQIENYRKALEEEAREAERERNAITGRYEGRIQDAFTEDFRGGIGRSSEPKTYVSVNVRGGAKTYNYEYMIYE